MTRIVILATIAFASIQTAAQTIPQQAHDTVRTIQELRAIHLPDFEAGVSPPPPARVPGLLRRLNGQLRELITLVLNDRSRSGMPSGQEIVAELRAAGWKEIPNYKWDAYGEIVQIPLGVQTGYNPGILVASTQLWVPCGSADPDTAIYVFEGSGRDWKLILATDADFNTIGEHEASGIQYDLSRPDAKGNWFLAIAQTPPACGPSPTPSQVNLRYKILRPGPSPDEPRILLDHVEPLSDKFQPAFRLEVDDDWFAITKGKERKLDGEPGVSIARYQVTGDELTRIQPLALTPQDFLDEWAQSDWAEASHASGESPDLSKWHSTLNALAHDSTEIEFVQPCREPGTADKTWLAGLWIDPKLNPANQNERLYIVVSERHHAFFVDSVSTTRPAGCPGKARPLLTSWDLPKW